MTIGVPRSKVIETRVVTDALLAMLNAAIPGHVFYDSDPDGEASLEDGYGIVYGVPGGIYNGAPLWSPESDAILTYQITSVSSQRAAAEWLADRVRLTMCSRRDTGGFQVTFPALAGVQVINREPDGTPPGTLPEGPPNSRIYNIPERYRIAAVSI